MATIVLMGPGGRVGDDGYALPDPQLRAYDHGVGTLMVDGELGGYLASVVGRMTLPSRQSWPWFVVVWADGTKEPTFEDYGPHWLTVRELDVGRLEHFEPSIPGQRRFLGMRFTYSTLGGRCVYDFAWLEPDAAAAKWKELGLADSDFQDPPSPRAAPGQPRSPDIGMVSAGANLRG